MCFHLGRYIYGRHYTNGCHHRGVGSIDLFLDLSKSRFVHGAHGHQGVRSFEFMKV